MLQYSGTLNQIAEDIGVWRKTKQFFTPGDISTIENRDLMLGKLMLVVTEIAEAAEAVRHEDSANFQEELADAVIRILDICDACNINISRVVQEKMFVNEKRPVKHDKRCNL
jgi:NTP pyrophosphatase (non-canonical NTP hydrolase)